MCLFIFFLVVHISLRLCVQRMFYFSFYFNRLFIHFDRVKVWRNKMSFSQPKGYKNLLYLLRKHSGFVAVYDSCCCLKNWGVCYCSGCCCHCCCCWNKKKSYFSIQFCIFIYRSMLSYFNLTVKLCGVFAFVLRSSFDTKQKTHSLASKIQWSKDK